MRNPATATVFLKFMSFSASSLPAPWLAPISSFVRLTTSAHARPLIVSVAAVACSALLAGTHGQLSPGFRWILNNPPAIPSSAKPFTTTAGMLPRQNNKMIAALPAKMVMGADTNLLNSSG